ncbi:MAG TPA: hypothetical protein VJ302_14880 [Blastocatellia bacterium]|nr:hypothetical protein [Blastocatellia bacterium]
MERVGIRKARSGFTDSVMPDGRGKTLKKRRAIREGDGGHPTGLEPNIFSLQRQERAPPGPNTERTNAGSGGSRAGQQTRLAQHGVPFQSATVVMKQAEHDVAGRFDLS